MTLLNVERIKLFSTRSPYWCLALIPVVGALITFFVSTADGGSFASLPTSQLWVNLAVSVVTVMAGLAITTEYRFGTIRNSFLAAPNRVAVLIAKALLLAALSAVAVLATSGLTYLLAKAVAGSQTVPGAFDIVTAADARVLWGPALIGAFAAVLAVGVGALIRQSAGAIAVLLIWPLIIEGLMTLFGDTGRKIAPWLPFSAAQRFYLGDVQTGPPVDPTVSVPTWWQGGLIFAGTALVIFIVAAVVIKRRDA